MSQGNWKSSAEMVQDLKGELRVRLQLAGEYVTSQAKLNCPVDYGNLRSSIHWEDFETEHAIGVRIGTPVEYAPYIEFGTGIFAENGMGRKTPWVYYHERLKCFITTHGMTPKPFLRPALFNSRDKIVAILGHGYSVK